MYFMPGAKQSRSNNKAVDVLMIYYMSFTRLTFRQVSPHLISPKSSLGASYYSSHFTNEKNWDSEELSRYPESHGYASPTYWL